MEVLERKAIIIHDLGCSNIRNIGPGIGIWNAPLGSAVISSVISVSPGLKSNSPLFILSDRLYYMMTETLHSDNADQMLHITVLRHLYSLFYHYYH